MIKLNVVTVVRNDKIGLELTAKSVENFKKAIAAVQINHIIIDGKSNDDTAGLIDEYSRKEDCTIISEKDNSLFDGMNKALRVIGNNELIIYINAGDELLVVDEPSFLVSLRELQESNYQLLFLQAECSWRESCWLHPRSDIFKEKKIFDKWLRFRTPVHQAIIFKNKTERPILYSSLFRIQSDTLLIYELLKYNEWRYGVKNLKIARFYLGGLSNNYLKINKNVIQFWEQLVIMIIRKDSIVNMFRLPVLMVLKYFLNTVLGNKFYELMLFIQKKRS